MSLPPLVWFVNKSLLWLLMDGLFPEDEKAKLGFGPPLEIAGKPGQSQPNSRHRMHVDDAKTCQMAFHVRLVNFQKCAEHLKGCRLAHHFCFSLCLKKGGHKFQGSPFGRRLNSKGLGLVYSECCAKCSAEPDQGC